MIELIARWWLRISVRVWDRMERALSWLDDFAAAVIYR